MSTVTFNYGARFDVVHEYMHENQISPRANLVWQATADTTLHAGYSRYFTPPPFELVGSSTLGLFANTTAASSVTQNDSVKPERSHYFNVGQGQVVAPGLTVGST